METVITQEPISFLFKINNKATVEPDFISRVIIEVAENWMIDGYYCRFCQLGIDYKGDKTEHPENDCIVPRCIELAEMLKGEKDKP